MAPMRFLILGALLFCGAASAADAQRWELSVLGGASSPSGKEYERVTIVGPTTERVRATASRLPGTGIGFQTSISVAESERWRLEGGMLFQQVERRTRETAVDDVSGPYATTKTADGQVLSAWVAAMYRPIQGTRGHLGLIAGPVLVNYGGLAYTQTEDPMGYPFPAVSLGLLLGARGAWFPTRSVGLQLSLEHAIHGFYLADREADFANPGVPTSSSTELQRELRVTVGLIYRYF